MARNTQSAPAYDPTRVIERPDGFYWLDAETEAEYGPYATLLEALQDMEYNEETDFEPGESLAEAEEEIGINDWIDPDTGAPGEGLHHYFD